MPSKLHVIFSHFHLHGRERLFLVHLRLHCSLRASISCMTSALVHSRLHFLGYLHLCCPFRASLPCTPTSTLFIEGSTFWLIASVLFTQSISFLHTHMCTVHLGHLLLAYSLSRLDTFLIQILLALLFCYLCHNGLYTLQSLPCTPTLRTVMQPILFLQSFCVRSFTHSFACMFVWACMHACHQVRYVLS